MLICLGGGRGGDINRHQVQIETHTCIQTELDRALFQREQKAGVSPLIELLGFGVDVRALLRHFGG